MGYTFQAKGSKVGIAAQLLNYTVVWAMLDLLLNCRQAPILAPKSNAQCNVCGNCVLRGVAFSANFRYHALAVIGHGASGSACRVFNHCQHVSHLGSLLTCLYWDFCNDFTFNCRFCRIGSEIRRSQKLETAVKCQCIGFQSKVAPQTGQALKPPKWTFYNAFC
ncbi:hypothetical protein PoMZ_09145 [Pyricularia oryzae]|uniref:Uncharacterized protein n=1 Tax=Pyricularia oryzae TaxID=318829 RepID=A0A4V1C4N1_PYROR|nr:hypothetical protein PoMZ_09145 [Pyricularia oryzae]